MQLAEGRVTVDQIPPAVEMGQTVGNKIGAMSNPTPRRKSPVGKKATRAAARPPQDDAAAAPLS